MSKHTSHERNLESLTFAMAPDEMPEAKKMIRKYIKEYKKEDI